jgi:soluble lytic murein transglycosylase
MLILAGETGLVDDFVLHLDERTTNGDDLALSVELAEAAGRPDLVLGLGKRAGWRSVVYETAAFPIPQVPGLELVTRDGVPPELVLALARQESQFRPAARSHAGATGLLQVMPATAKGVARRIGLPYDQRRLASDPDYNLRIGRAYIRWQLDSFGELPLALAAYNAGPARVSQWLKSFGDPRRGQIDELDWIELIPFDETRNYVHRVLESRAVYRHVLANRSAAAVPRLAPAALRDPPLPSEKPREGT